MSQSPLTMILGDRRGRVAIVTLIVLALLALGVHRAPAAQATTAAKVAPAVAPVGGGITVSGDALDAVTAVTFLGAAGSQDDVAAEHHIAIDPKKLVVQVPAGAQSGPVAVSASGGSSSISPPVTIVRPPAVTALPERVGKGGDEITVNGTDLVGSKKTTVVLAGKKLAPSVASANTLKVKIPAGLAGGPANLDVVTDGGTTRTGFYIAPEIKAVTPKNGSTAGGTVITITGSGFTGVDRVTVGGVTAPQLLSVSDKEIVAVTPPGSAGMAPLVVQTAAGDVVAVSGAATFEYQPLPTITAVSQNWNGVDSPSPVTFTGVNLTPETIVRVGAVVLAPADLTVDPQAGSISLAPPASAKPAVTAVSFTNPQDGTKGFTTTVPFGYIIAPTVAKLDKTSGPAGTVVNIAGTGFGSGTTTRFGETSAACTVVSFVLLRCTAPAGPGAEDVVDVTVTNGVGSSAPAATAKFTYKSGAPAAAPPAAAVSALLPPYGTTGSTVALTGANLNAVTRVDFTGVEGGWVAAATFLPVSPTRLVVTVPTGAGTGPLRVHTPAGRATTEPRVFSAAVRPSVTAIKVVGEATFGATGGDLLVIQGNGLMAGKVRGLVTIGGKPAPVLARPAPTPRTMVVKVPPSVGGREPVVVTTPLGSVAAEAYVYFVPQIKAVKAGVTSGSGTVVSITGSGFNGADGLVAGAGRLSAVRFGGIAVTRMVSMSDKEIVAIAAPDSPLDVDRLLVTTQHEEWVGSSNDRVRSTSAPVPEITGVSPNVLVLGQSPSPVTITGQNLRASSDVLFGTLEATVTSAATNGTSMVVLPPARTTTATVPVTVTNVVLGEELTDILPGGFSYLPVPSVASFSPASGLTGAAPPAVTITGANLRPDSVVRFGTSPATVQGVNSAGTSMTVAPPISNEVGTVAVTVTNILDGGEQLTATASGGYQYQLAVATVTGKSHGTALPGETVTITGTSFVGVTAVRFGSISVAYTVANPTTIFATVPLTPSGAQGQVTDIRIVNGTGNPSTGDPATADDWTWSNHAIVTGLSATTGSRGSTVTLTGTGFSGATEVRFGDRSATSFSVLSDTTATAVVPATPSGATTTNIVVRARGLDSPASDANRWTWHPIGATTSVSPNSGVTTTTTVTVTGRNLAGMVAAVQSGAGSVELHRVASGDVIVVPAGSITDVSTTEFRFIPPSGAPAGNKKTGWTVVIRNGSGEVNTLDSAVANTFTFA